MFSKFTVFSQLTNMDYKNYKFGIKGLNTVRLPDVSGRLFQRKGAR